MKILELGKFYPPHRGGMETLLRSFCEGFAARGHQVDAIVANDERRSRVDVHSKARIHRLGSWGTLLSTSLCPRYPIAARRWNGDICHAHLPNPLADSAIFGLRPRCRLVISYVSDIVRQRFLLWAYRPVQLKVLARADRIVVATRRQMECSPILRNFVPKCSIIPFGIDLQRFANPSPAALSNAFEARTQLQPAGPIVLTVGRLVGYKGHRYLLEAARSFEGHIWIVGSGPLEPELNRLAAQLGVRNKVHFFGAISDDETAGLYHACDLFVLPSISANEAFGLVQVEAMACSKPVISCDLPSGVPEVNLDGVTGVIVPPADAAALSAAIRDLAANPGRANQLGLNGYQRARAEYDEKVMVTRYLDCFQSLRESRSNHQAPETIVDELIS